MIVIVILHYQAYSMTKQCIESIENNLDVKQYHIVVVDNDSPNGSGKILQEDFKQKDYIHFIFNDENVGFARANNEGYQYAKRFEPDFIVIINNDVIIDDKDFINKISDIYEQTKFHVLGPDVISYGVEHQSPLRVKPLTLEETDEAISFHNKVLKMSKLKFYFYYAILFIKIKTRKKLIKMDLVHEEISHNFEGPIRMQNVVIHGSCIIYSPNYIKREALAFNPATFMYYEEDLLLLKCIEKKYTVIFDSNIYVRHLGEVSTRIINSNRYNRVKNTHQRYLDSLKQYKNILEEGNFDY